MRDHTSLIYAEPSIITLTSSRYYLDNVDRGVKHQIIIIVARFEYNVDRKML